MTKKLDTNLGQKRKAVIFARVSTARQEKEGLSLKEIQIPRAKEYAEKHGLEVKEEDIFSVSETGGQYKIRKKFAEMVNYVKKHDDITDIIAFRVDRITRNFQDAVVVDDLRSKYNKRIHFIDDNFVLDKDSKSNDILQWDMKVLIARQYLERVKEDGLNSKLSKLRKGELPWSAPFGYQHTKDANGRKTVAVIPDKAYIVREAFLRYSTGNYSYESLAAELDVEFGLHFGNAKDIMFRLLKNKFYIGIMVDSKTGDEYPHNYEHLVSIDLFNRVQDVIDGHCRNRRRYYGIESVYRAMIRCPICGCCITSDHKRKKQKNGNVHEYIYYHCTDAKHKHRDDGLKIGRIEEKKVNLFMEELLRMLKPPEERMAELRDLLSKAHAEKNLYFDEKRAEWMSEQKRLLNRQRKTYDLYMDGSITREDYNENMSRYREAVSDLEMKLKNINAHDQGYYITVSYLMNLFEHAADIFEVAKAAEKRQILSLLLSDLEFDGETINFTLLEPFDKLFKRQKGSVWQGRTESNHDLRFWRPLY